MDPLTREEDPLTREEAPFRANHGSGKDCLERSRQRCRPPRPSRHLQEGRRAQPCHMGACGTDRHFYNAQEYYTCTSKVLCDEEQLPPPHEQVQGAGGGSIVSSAA